MLNLFGRSDATHNHCDRLSRRGFLRVGSMAAGGLSLSQLIAAEQQAGTGRSHKAIINIYLPGGPSHLDMFDLKPDATSEVRGEFRPIRTNVPGMEICELFPQLAKMADKFALIRSLYDSEGRHDCYQCMTGRTFKDQNSAPPGGWPAMGAWVSRLQGSLPGVPRGGQAREAARDTLLDPGMPGREVQAWPLAMRMGLTTADPSPAV